MLHVSARFIFTLPFIGILLQIMSAEEAEKIKADGDKEFEGNYIEKFQKQGEGEYYPGKVVSWEISSNKVLFIGEFASMELTVISSTIFKIRYGIDGYFEDDFSYAIASEFKAAPTSFSAKEKKNIVTIATEKISCVVDLNTFSCTMLDKSGAVVLEDEKGFHWKEESKYGGNVPVCTKKATERESFFGLGDKTGKLNRRGTRNELWGTDCYGYTNETDPVYKNIPFYLGINGGGGYGIFFDNTFRTFFDFGKERPDVTSFWAQGGEMRYYFIYGPELLSVTKQYTELTGKPKMPPKWALGYHQSKWSYYPEATVRELGNTFRKLRIPCDVIHLDIDYMDGYRVFTWDKTRFPDPQKMIADLREQGFKSIVIIDPGIKIDKNYSVYQEGVANDYFCKRMDGDRFKGSVWPGPCHFPDFTNPIVRDWWSGLVDELMDSGIGGIWNDMNEPAVFETGSFPRDIRHDYDGHPSSHRKSHNVYGSLMAKATNDGQQKHLGNGRAFTITRSAYAGIQRDSSVWTGDNMATWEHLKIANVQCQRLAESGVSFAGSDVGGFIGSPDGELYVRWIQMAVFHPFFRTHSSGDHGDKEPWAFGEPYTDIVRNFIEFRYKLIPYIYSTFWQYASGATPMIRPFHLLAQDNHESHFREEEFMLGDSFLICPVSASGISKRTMYLPRGDWYNFWTREKLEGRQEIEVATPLDQIPLFVRAGAVVPMQPVMQYVDEFNFDALDLHIYHGAAHSILYEDDGMSREYEKGEQRLNTFTTRIEGENKFSIVQESDGKYQSCYSKYRLHIYGISVVNSILLDGVKTVAIKEDAYFKIEVPKDFKQITIT